MDLSAINRTPIGSAARAVGRVTYGAIDGVAGILTGAVWRTRSAWQVLMNRTRFDYAREVGDPATNSIVGAVVGWIARNFPEAPVRIVHEETRAVVYLRSRTGPGAMLRLLEKPNPKYSGVAQWMATVVDWIVTGDAYWFKVRYTEGFLKGRVKELWWLPSHMVEPRWPQDDGRVFISHYEYKVDGVAYRIDPRSIVHFRNGIDPNNTRKGVSKLRSLLREIFTDDEAANFTASLMRNLGVPGVIIAPANTTIPGMQSDPEKIKTTFMEKFSGDKRGEPMVLTAPTEIKVLSWSPEAMNLKELRRIPEERISGVLGVPAMVAQLGAGLDRSSFTNYETAAVVAYTQGVIPDQRLFAADLEVQLLPEFASEDQIENEMLDVWFDWTQVSAMQFAIASAWKIAESAATKGLITRAEFKRRTSQRVAPGDEVYIIPNNFVMVPVGGEMPPNGTARATVMNGSPPALGSTQPLLLETTASEVRCGDCNRLLAEAMTPPYRISCPRCKAIAESPPPSVEGGGTRTEFEYDAEDRVSAIVQR